MQQLPFRGFQETCKELHLLIIRLVIDEQHFHTDHTRTRRSPSRFNPAFWARSSRKRLRSAGEIVTALKKPWPNRTRRRSSESAGELSGLRVGCTSEMSVNGIRWRQRPNLTSRWVSSSPYRMGKTSPP